MSEIPTSPVTTSSVPNEQKYKGVRGWLLFFCIALTILAPIRALVEVSSSYKMLSYYFGRVPNLQAFWITLTLLNVGLTIYGVVVGVNLWRVRSGAVRNAKRFLWCLLAFSVGALFLPILFGVPVASIAYVKPAGILAFFVWFFYLKKSKRVKATYPD
ncbi:MAG: hypothetical protein V7609_1644 [Verrucomicrobiota bacterium]